MALRLPPSTPTARRMGLGVINTAEDLFEAQLMGQVEQLSKTAAGRKILESANKMQEKLTWLHKFRSRCKGMYRHTVSAKNMHPLHNSNRRKSRAINLHCRLQDNQAVLYVAAAEYRHKEVYVMAIADHKGEGIAALTIPAKSPEETEAAAIACAMTIEVLDEKIIISGSKTVINNFIKGRVHPPAEKLISK